jgi:hypothetical protein
MARKKLRKSLRSNGDEWIRGGKPLARREVRDCLLDVREDQTTRRGDKASRQSRLMKTLSSAQGHETKAPGSPRADKALEVLLKDHKRLARQKLALPRRVGGFGGLLAGQIRATIVPPFDYDIIIPSRLAGNDAILQATSDRRTGLMNLSAVTANERGRSGGSMYATVGIYFHPPGRGTLTVSAAPTYSYQWWTNSLSSGDFVRSFGQLGLTVYGVDVASQTVGENGTIEATASSEFFSWNETRSGEINLDFDSNVDAPVMSAQLNVNRNLVYLIFVDADVHVDGEGWPGSVAGSKLSVAVPYITYNFMAEQVIQAI